MGIVIILMEDGDRERGNARDASVMSEILSYH